MSISAELNSKIEADMNQLDKRSLLRSGRSYNDFVDEYSGLLAQAVEDRVELEASGLDFGLMEEYSAVLEKMALIYGERVASEGTVAEVVKQFREAMPNIDGDKKALAAIVRFIIARTDNNDVKKSYDMIRKGYGNMDTINDIIAMVNIIKSHSEIALQVKPGGKVIDEPYLDDLHQKALDLVALKGKADTASDDVSAYVDRLNRIISLAVAAEREIKLFAELAFYDDSEKYSKDYASESLRQFYKNKIKKDDAELQLN